MTAKFLATAVAAAAIVGGAAAGVTAAVSITPAASPAVAPMVFGTPLPMNPMPLNPAADLPSADQLAGVLNSLANPSVPFAAKGYLIEGGIGRLEAKTADALMRSAIAKGQVPLNFSIGPIAPVGPGAATATVTAAGPAMPSTTQAVTFVNQGGWKLSRASASTILTIFGG
ncbi:hypothetical protein [Mycolicibacterium sp.]|uniref:hypothetical protein n=1 Tax=Mycolicibacterium sp. TaxID=2320850 RepID=UPI0028ADE1A1|nr:hypothetical protein [Mycolicibacterium sp.]